MSRAWMSCRSREARAGRHFAAPTSLVLHSLDLDLQRHLRIQAERLAGVDAERGAVETRRGLGAAALARLEHEVGHALEVLDGEIQRTRHAVQGQLAD